MGTPLYMAPELAHGVKYAGPTSDVFSLGVLCYELLANTQPFEVPAFIAAQARIDMTRQRQRSLSALCPELPADIAELLERTVRPQPARRPSALEVAAALTARS